jgi:hypothetical protein
MGMEEPMAKNGDDDYYNYNVNDLPPGVRVTTSETPEEVKKRKGGEIQEVRKQTIFSITGIKYQRVSHRHHKTFRPGQDDITRPGKVKYIVSSKQRRLMEFEELVQTYREKYGADVDNWIDLFVFNNTALIDKPRDLTLIRKLVIASLLKGPATINGHKERINFALKEGENQNKFRITEDQVETGITKIRQKLPYNHLRKYLGTDYEDGHGGKGAKKIYWFPPEFMHIKPDLLFALSAARANGVSYTEHQLRKDAKAYFVRIGDMDAPEVEDIVEDVVEQEPDSAPPDQTHQIQDDDDFRTAVEKALAAGMAALKHGKAVPKGISARIGDREISIHIEKLIVQFY